MDLIEEFLKYEFDPMWAAKVESRRRGFVDIYNCDKILELSQDEYYYAGKEDTFCFRIQRDLACMASMGNAFPAAFGVYVDLKKRLKMSPKLSKMYGENFEGALQYQKQQIVALLKAGKDKDYYSIENNNINSLLKYKILSVYYPELYFPVCAFPTAKLYCDVFGIRYHSSNSMLDLVLALSKWSMDNLPENWSLFQAMWLGDWLWGKGKKLNDPKLLVREHQVNIKPIVKEKQYVEVKSQSAVEPITNRSKSYTKSDFMRLFRKGCRVRNKVLGDGTIKDIGNDRVIVKFDSGQEKSISIETCLMMNLLERIGT